MPSKNERGWCLMLRRQCPDRYRIERDDEAAVFNSDDEAIAHVKAAGSKGGTVCWLSYELHKAHAELDAAEIAMHSGGMNQSNRGRPERRWRRKTLTRPSRAGWWICILPGRVPAVVQVTETAAAGRLCRELRMGGSQQCGFSDWRGTWVPF